ncbi:MAG: PQQ-binding-like beta-propeller repeat protein, partial [Proteobacteria bacterium]|nr:PQQ-binding-like beta-propeller repeat protein [Pseudomonadota bacterium]
MWKTSADVKSRLSVGGDFLVALEGKQLVARDQLAGGVRWKISLDGTFLGACADRERAYVVVEHGGTYVLAAYDGSSGKRLWTLDSLGKIGAPVAQGGLLFVPFLDQWLALLDGQTGEQLTRIRGIDDQIAMLRATSQTVYYGSKRGVFRLDARSTSGKRELSTYGAVKVPPQLDRATYGRDVYDVIQQGYSAFDRARVLYAAAPTDTGAMVLQHDGYAIHYFRYILGYKTDGTLSWAYAHPRVELVASEHLGASLAAVSTTGEVIALDPTTGAIRGRVTAGTGAQVLGATFDAAGWAPNGETTAVATITALVAIARDRDARFDGVKELAVQELAKLPGEAATTELLNVLADRNASLRLKDAVVALLVARKDPSSLIVLAHQLDAHADYLAKTDNEAVGPVAKAIAGLGGVQLDPAHVELALAGLTFHLQAASTATPELVQLIAALHVIGGGHELPLLDSHLLLYHADDELAADASWARAIVAALVDGGPPEREVLRQVAADPRTKAALVDAIRESVSR